MRQQCGALTGVFMPVQVQELYEVAPGPPWGAGERRESRIVFIGRRLCAAALRSALEDCLEERKSALPAV